MPSREGITHLHLLTYLLLTQFLGNSVGLHANGSDQKDINNKNTSCEQINNLFCYFGKRDPITRLRLLRSCGTLLLRDELSWRFINLTHSCLSSDSVTVCFIDECCLLSAVTLSTAVAIQCESDQFYFAE